jgi:hypothetical protein
MYVSMRGASKGGRLKEAKMVRQSRTVKRANVGIGTGRLGPLEPKSWVNWLSLYRQRARLDVDVATNLVVPAVVEPMGVLARTEAKVSMAFAVK